MQTKNECKRGNETQTQTRIYYTIESNGLWTANYQSLNSKTGKPWLASRSIKKNRNAFKLSNWKSGVSAVFTCNPPSILPPDTMLSYGFSSEELALAAIAQEKLSSGK